MARRGEGCPEWVGAVRCGGGGGGGGGAPLTLSMALNASALDWIVAASGHVDLSNIAILKAALCW